MESLPANQLIRVLVVSAVPEDALEIERVLFRAGYEPRLERLDITSFLVANSPHSGYDVILVATAEAGGEIFTAISGRCASIPVLAYAPEAHEYLGVQVARAVSAAQARQAITDAERRAEDAHAQAASAVLESEERYRALIESTFDLIGELDVDGRCTYASANFCQRLGYTTSELIGSTVFERIHVEDADRVVTKFANLMASRPSGPVEFRHAHKNGDWVWLEGTMRVVPASEDRRVALIARDITERKRHERELATLITLAKTINSQSDLGAVARELHTHLRDLIPFDTVNIALLSGDELSVISYAGDDVTEDKSGVISRQKQPDHPAWQALARGSVWVVNRWNMPGETEAVSSTRAFIKVPLLAGGELIGLLNFDAERPYIFTDDHARLAGMAGEQVAVAVRQVRMLEKTLSAETRYRTLVQDTDAIVWEADPDTLRFTFVSPQAQTWLGYPLQDWLSSPRFWSERLHPDDRDAVLTARRRAIETAENYQLEYRVMTAKGDILWLRDLGTVETRDSKATHLRGLMVDITSHKQFEHKILERNTILKAVQEAAADGICVMDESESPISYNRRFVEMWPIPVEMMDELRDKNQVMSYLASKVQDPGDFMQRVGALNEDPHATTQDELRLKDGRLFEVYSAPAMTDDQKSFGRVWSLRDVTERERYEKQLTHQAFHDPLTQLPNRALFMDRLKHAMERSHRFARLTGVLFLDLDRFKVVNDSLGHPVGDELLKQVSARIARSTRPMDTAARFGGDEFTVLVEDIISHEDAVHVAQRILENLQAPFNLAGHEVHVTGSIGIALSTSREDSADDLLRKADVAMYWSKNKGSGRFEVFDTKMSAQALERLQLEIDLRQAIKRDQLHLRYQPLVHLESGYIVGAEALLRWQHPTRGLVNPTEFIPIAEETGMILPIGQWVMREACRQAHTWHITFPHDPPLKISINLSAKQLEQPGFSGEVKKILEETELDAHSLELEITESVVMENVPANIELLEDIKKLGVTLAIDDFGTGYSSLSYLEHFPLDALKIDRAFVGQIGNHLNAKNGNGHGNGTTNGNTEKGDGLAILKAVSTLGQTLGVSVTAEGIETAEQREQLTALSCKIGQGFHFAEPLEPEAIGQLLSRNSRL